MRVTDSEGESDTTQVLVTVADTTPPVLACPAAVTAECTGSTGTQVSLVASASDACSPGSPVIGNDRTGGGADASGPYPLGTSPVGFTATDPAGNTASCGAAVTVRDTLPPTLALAADPGVLWPPNHRLVPVRVAWQTSDVCDPAPRVVLVSVGSSEAADEPGDGDGRTTPDIAGLEIGTPDVEVLLRAERSGTGTGRSYDLRYGAIDGSGNRVSAFLSIRVPHDLGEGPEPLLIKVEGTGTPGQVHLYWSGVGGAEGYDVIEGEVGNLSQAAGGVELGPVRVLSRGQAGTSWVEPAGGALPAPGEALFYLVQWRSEGRGSGFGTESARVPREPARCRGGCP